MHKVFLTLIFILGIPIITSAVGIEGELGIDLINQPAAGNITNYNNITNNYYTATNYTFNDTQFSTTGSYVNLLESWLKVFGNTVWCSLSGCNMTGNINMGGNNITNAGTITADFFVGDGSGLTGVSGEQLNFETYINGSVFNTIKYNLTAGDVDEVKRTIEPGKQFIFGETFT